MTSPRAVGINIFSGGFTVGVEQAGFEIAGQWEECAAGARTFELNYPQVPHPLSADEWPIAGARGIELVYSNPPCAVWSPSGKHLGMADPRIEMTQRSMQAALAVEPAVFVLESVPRAWSLTGGRDYYTGWAQRFMERGYAVTVLLTSQLLHGGAQARERWHFIAHQVALELRTPEVDPTQVLTIRAVISDLESLETTDPNHVSLRLKPGHLNVIDRLRQGEGWDKAYARTLAEGLPAIRNRFVAGRPRYDAPAPTVLDVHALVHPTQRRLLTVREGARLCGYPDSFRFNPVPGRTGGKSSEVTQAVPPPMGRYLGTFVRRALDVGHAPTFEERAAISVIDWRPIGAPYKPRVFAETLRSYLEGQ